LLGHDQVALKIEKGLFFFGGNDTLAVDLGKGGFREAHT
jgi:hypothetical protein